MSIVTFVRDKDNREFAVYGEHDLEFPGAKRLIVEDVQANVFHTLSKGTPDEAQEIIERYLRKEK